MSNPKFAVKPHSIEGQHVREYSRGLANGWATPRIQVKQYVPVSNPHPLPRNVTIVAAGVNGFIKEFYEPLFEDLSTELEQHGLQIRSIWIVDMYVLGSSAIENGTARGNDRM